MANSTAGKRNRSDGPPNAKRPRAPLQRQLCESCEVVYAFTKQPVPWHPSSRSSGRALAPAHAPSAGSCKATCRCKQSPRRIPAVKHRGADTDSGQARVSNCNPTCMQPGVPPTPENAIGAPSTAPTTSSAPPPPAERTPEGSSSMPRFCSGARIYSAWAARSGRRARVRRADN